MLPNSDEFYMNGQSPLHRGQNVSAVKPVMGMPTNPVAH